MRATRGKNLIAIWGSTQFRMYVVAQCWSGDKHSCHWQLLGGVRWTVNWNAFVPKLAYLYIGNRNRVGPRIAPPPPPRSITCSDWIRRGNITWARVRGYSCTKLRDDSDLYDACRSNWRCVDLRGRVSSWRHPLPPEECVPVMWNPFLHLLGQAVHGIGQNIMPF